MLTFKLNLNQQTFNKQIATFEKTPIFKLHKSYKNSLSLTSQNDKKITYINAVKQKLEGNLYYE